MSYHGKLTRRNVLRGVAAGGVSVLAGAGAAARGSAAESIGAFYQPDGAFDPKAARKAYYRMMEAFHYPISDVLRTDQLWVCDFVQRNFAVLGMGGIFWINESGTYGTSGVGAYDGEFEDQAFGYMGHDIYLLPGQMIPEHRHLGGPEGYGPKMEAWQVRHGDVQLFGQYAGAGDEIPISDLPERDRPWGYDEPWFKSKYVAHRTAKSGKVYSLKAPESWHFMRAGTRGAIVTEYATYHNHVEFSKPGMVFDNSKSKG